VAALAIVAGSLILARFRRRRRHSNGPPEPSTPDQSGPPESSSPPANGPADAAAPDQVGS
jgi:hypothetical protein